MPMNHSQMPDAWLQAATRANPIRIAEKTGNIITCPVRLFFVNLLEPAKPMEGDTGAADKKPTYNVVAGLPPYVEQGIQTVIRALIYQKERAHFPNNFGPDGRSFGLHDPLRDQREKMRTRQGKENMGFTAGLLCLTASTLIKPQVTDTAGNPIIDPSRVYPGVWALLALSLFEYGLKPARPKIGVSFGLQNVMLFADDTRCGGTGSNPADDFAGVNIDQAYNPAAAFGNTPAAPAAYQPPAQILPPPQPVYAPAYPAAPPGYASVAPPAQQWAPPAPVQTAEDLF